MLRLFACGLGRLPATLSSSNLNNVLLRRPVRCLIAVTCPQSRRQHRPRRLFDPSSVTSPTSEDTTAATTPPSSGPEQPEKKGGFLQATYEELKLVVWPSRQQLFSESIAVILMVSLSAAAIAALSRFYGWAASQVFR